MGSGSRPSCPFHGVVSLDEKTFLHFVCLHPAVFYKWVLAIHVLQGLTLHYALSIPSHLGEVGGVAMQLSVASCYRNHIYRERWQCDLALPSSCAILHYNELICENSLISVRHHPSSFFCTMPKKVTFYNNYNINLHAFMR